MPLWIDSLDFARNAREVCGAVQIADLPRLQDMLAVPDGEINYVVRGSQDQYGKPMLKVVLDGQCQLRCQRCLQGISYPVHLATRLLLVRAKELDEFSDDENEIDSIPAEEHLNVLGMIEEELLLSLPFAPMHPAGECQPAMAGYVAHEMVQAEKNPFAVLSELKRK